MIEHLRGRDRKLELLGWTGRDAEWIALVCLHSGVFTRARFCQYFDTTNRVRAQRFVKALIDRKQALEIEWPIMNGGAKTCRISSKAIYRALGVENIRHRRQASNLVVMRRLLSLDFVLEHPGMNWLPAEPEKVEFFEEIGLPLRLIPRRIYYGVVDNQKRYFALKLPLAVDPETVTFAYVDPGHQTDRELYSWGAAHGPLWDALRKKGRQVRVLARFSNPFYSRAPFPLALDDPGSVLAVKGSLRRFAPWTAPDRSERRAAYEGKGGGRAVGREGGSLVR